MKRLLFAFAVFPLFAFACSGSSKDEGGEDGDDGADGSAATFIESYCDALSPCCAAVSLPTDGATCRTFLSANFESGYELNAAAASECTDWLDSLTGTAHCGASAAVPDACADVFVPTGDGAPGESCETPADCARSSEGGVRCLGSGGNPGICQLVIEGTEGSAPCAWSVRGGTSTSSSNFDVGRVYSCNAADGLYCNDTACVPVVTTGNPCLESRHCELGAYCALDGFCTPQLPNGSPCQDSDECSGGSCTNGDCAAGSLGITLLCGGEL